MCLRADEIRSEGATVMPTFEERFWEKYKRVPGLHDYNAELAAKDRTIERVEAESQRAKDLVRFARHFLHDEELISDDEYAAIVQDNENGKRVARLETYDQLRAKLAALEEKQ